MSRFYIVKADESGSESVWSILSDGEAGWTIDPTKMVSVRQEVAQELVKRLPMVSVPKVRVRSVRACGMGLDIVSVVNKTGEVMTRILE